MSEDLMLTLFYLFFCLCIIYPPTEFISAGITIEKIFGKFLDSEHENFIYFHIKRSVITLLVFAWLPIGYLALLFITGSNEKVKFMYLSENFLWQCFMNLSIILPLCGALMVLMWKRNNFKRHPIVINLKKYNTDWEAVASDINIEFRRVDKIIIQTNALTKIVATENWLLKVTPFNMEIIHQTDANLSVKEARTHDISLHNTNQFLNIEIKSVRPNVNSFCIRINAAEFRDLQDRISRTITIPPNVNFHKSVVDHFIDIFKETIKNNVRYDSEQEIAESCIGCMQAQPNVKLQKLCEDVGEPENHCMTCYCRPLWCVDCMARWFASRQDNERQDLWLSSKCTCPMCRAKFCILDVCFLIDGQNES